MSHASDTLQGLQKEHFTLKDELKTLIFKAILLAVTIGIGGQAGFELIAKHL